ncbi:MAG TPA: hypothetical protein DCY79_11840 [Planctomycetaceae bacterium]|nr:hypothetical protein [Blastopirellula sp.]HAY80488.1 hypothetical protein [Planctomycetaceae bacterium]
MSSIYLDNAATTRIHPAVSKAMMDCFTAGYVNPASQHAAGRQARAKLDDAREEIVDLLGGERDTQLVLTSGGTEANNLAILGLVHAAPARVVLSDIEHPSVLAAGAWLQSNGYDVHWIPTLASGVIDLDAAYNLITSETALVSVSSGNHETGVLQPIASVAAHCQLLRVPLHVDAVQCVGKHSIHFAESGVSAMTVAPHKFHGPRGIGALVLRPECQITPRLFGGSQQFGLRAGTEDVALAVGFSTALRQAIHGLQDRIKHLSTIRDQFEKSLPTQAVDCVVHGLTTERLPHISNIGFRGLSREALLMNLDLLGVACSTGSACASGSSELSPVLRAMHAPDDVLHGALRFSFSIDTTLADCQLATDHILKSINNLADRFSTP